MFTQVIEMVLIRVCEESSAPLESHSIGAKTALLCSFDEFY